MVIINTVNSAINVLYEVVVNARSMLEMGMRSTIAQSVTRAYALGPPASTCCHAVRTVSYSTREPDMQSLRGPVKLPDFFVFCHLSINKDICFFIEPFSNSITIRATPSNSIKSSARFSLTNLDLSLMP